MHRRTITIALIVTVLTCLALPAGATVPQTVTYTLDASRSKFMAHADRSGLLWFKGKNHHLAASEFTGEVGITPQTITPASLKLVVKAASLHETGADFTEQQKQIINKELREIVLHPDQYPDIVFQSTNVTAKAAGPDRYEVKIGGNLTLHGVTRPITIPTVVTLNGNDLRAVGKFDIDRDDFKVKATSAFHGMVRVSNDIDFEFDIVGHRQ
ncbi:MAG TPA: YceI family protein [Pyrinomonadaceae bacterium]|nr:YceI family protein [Pyrinomonadaceae bacterium]